MQQPLVVTVDITRAAAVNGWMSELELMWLAEQAQRHTRIVELGSYMGRSTRALADNTEGVVYALDSWIGPWECDLPTEHRKQLYAAFRENLADHIAAARVIPIRCDHALPPTGIRPDMVFIDGDHSYGSAKHDCEFWREEIQPGGLLCGHDWDALSVQSAVRDVLGGDATIEVFETIWSVHV